jgi:hypothetical protein
VEEPAEDWLTLSTGDEGAAAELFTESETGACVAGVVLSALAIPATQLTANAATQIFFISFSPEFAGTLPRRGYLLSFLMTPLSKRLASLFSPF